MKSHLMIAAASLFFTLQPALAQNPDWKAGVASIKITPEKPVMMAGYASRNKPFERVESDLFAKALVLEDAKGQRVVLVTSDLIGFPAAVAEPICDRLRDKLGLKREQILLNSSHTHTGPIVSLESEGAEGQRTIEYTRWLQDRVVDVVTQASSKLEPVRLSHGSGVIHFVMNRREFTPNGVILGVNPRGLADRSVPVLRIDTADGKPRAVLFGAGSHNTTLGPSCYEICGDYAGFSQTFVQEKHPGVTALFMLGCAGDANPYPRNSMEDSKQHGAELGKEVCRVMDAKLRPVRGPLQLAFGRVDIPLQEVPSKADLEKLVKTKQPSAHVFFAQRALAMLEKGEKLPTHYSAPISVIQLGPDLTLVGLPGEVVVDYLTMVEKAIGPNHLWVAGYCHDVFGYLPSAKVLAEGGYETRGLYTGGVGLFSPKAQDVVIDKVKELAKQVGR